jgi:hypothetical protein
VFIGWEIAEAFKNKPVTINCLTMNKKTALCLSLLKGDILTCQNCLMKTGYSNVSREIIREVEKPFHIRIDRKKIESTDQWGGYVTWHQYRLIRTPENRESVKAMQQYCAEQMALINPKTTQEQKALTQAKLLLQ